MKARALTELRRRPTAAEIDDALGSLVISVDPDGTATVTRATQAAAAVALFGARLRADLVRLARLAPGVYGRTPTEAARVRVLVAAASISDVVEVHAPLALGGSHRGRLLIDLPRRAMRAIGLPAAEPGDRFTDGVEHVFFDDEALIGEASRAGLTYAGRRGAWALFARGAAVPAETADPFLAEVLRTVATLPEAERLRLHATPEQAVSAMRERGRRNPRRGPIGRARLRRAIGWLDAFHPGKPNCFRRTLAEIGLDAGAATETLVFGLDVGRTGHVALKGTEECTFDVAFEIAAPDRSSAEGR